MKLRRGEVGRRLTRPTCSPILCDPLLATRQIGTPYNLPVGNHAERTADKTANSTLADQLTPPFASGAQVYLWRSANGEDAGQRSWQVGRRDKAVRRNAIKPIAPRQPAASRTTPATNGKTGNSDKLRPSWSEQLVKLPTFASSCYRAGHQSLPLL
jgi:hypothetical protein